MSNGFSLDNLREGVKNHSSELSRNARARSVDGSDVDTKKPFTFEQPDYDRTEAPKDDMRTYWRQFETTPIIRKPVTSFASRVTEPGYFIEAKGLEETEVEELGNWLDKCAIVEGQPGKDFRLLAKKAIIQREVRGTALVEKAPHRDDSDKVAGLKLINPETVEAVTRPHQTILMAPDDLEDYEDAPEAESSGAAAWLQDVLETDQTNAFGTPVGQTDANDDDDTKIGFRRDEIIPLTRDADVGEVFGTSRIESVSDRIDGLKQKLDDNDEAIASKAYPLWLFLFGTEEEPWDSSDINNFMSAHEMDQFHPGMKQGVRGDVSVETVSGEVAEIAEYLEFDIQWIMASMPMPMFILGAFGSRSVGQVAGVAQQQDVLRQIEEARRELEEEFTPMLREVAEQKGISEEKVKNIKLRFGEPGQPDPEVTRSQQVIRYISDAQGGDTQTPEDRQAQRQQQQRQQQGQQQGEGEQPDNVITRGETPQSVNNPAPDQDIAGVDTDGNPFVDVKTGERQAQASKWAQVWSANSMAELEDITGVGDDSRSDISGDVSELFLNVRDRALDRLAEKYEASPNFAAVEYERIANSTVNAAINEANLKKRSRDVLRDEITDVAQQYGNHKSPFTQSQNASFFARNVVNAARDAAEEMLRRARVHIRNGVASDERWSDVRERVEQEFGRARLEDRADLIAYMELKNAVETTKLQEFEANDEIVGVRVSNPDATTPITQSLHGSEAYFENEEEVDNQIAEQADSDAMQQGFDPLPRTPPYHFRDTTSLEPIYQNEANR